jgi:hypothetical protein
MTSSVSRPEERMDLKDRGEEACAQTRAKRKRKKRECGVHCTEEAKPDTKKRQIRWFDSASSNTPQLCTWKPNQLSTIRTYHESSQPDTIRNNQS